MVSSDSGEERVRRRVVFRGRVQGVGFRYTTASIARRFPVVGYVMNLPDGSVELAVEAERKTIDQFLHDIRTEFGRNIDEVDASDLGTGEEFNRFEIRYYGR